jgi:hypothetical protein
MPGQFEREGVGTPFEDRSDRCIRNGARERVREVQHRDWIDHEGEPLVVSNCDVAFMPAVAAAHRVVYRQCIEQFIRQNDGGTVGKFAQASMPSRRDIRMRQRRALPRCKNRAGFDQM